MKKKINYISWTIISGNILVILIISIAFSLIFNKILKVDPRNEEYSDIHAKMQILGNTMMNLYEAEIIGSALFQENPESSFKKYQTITENITSNIYDLKNITTDSSQINKLDSVIVLLKYRQEDLKELKKNYKKLSDEIFYSKVIDSIKSMPQKDSNIIINKKIISVNDTIKIKRKKKIWDLFSKSKPDSITQIVRRDYVKSDTIKTGDDRMTVVDVVESVWQDVQKKRHRISGLLQTKERRFIEASNNITSQLKRIIREYGEEEVLITLKRIRQHNKLINSTVNTIGSVGGISILIMGLSLFIVLRDINKNKRYRRKLEAANKYGQRLLKTREDLIYSITHDIKSPLASIIGYIELMQNSPAPPSTDYIKNMKYSAEAISDLVLKLQNFSQIEKGKITVERIDFNPCELLRKIKESFLPIAGKKSISLESDISPDLDTLFCSDPLIITQILSNLVSNAIKYTPVNGMVKITADVRNSILKISVSDNGPGLNPEEQKIIFEAFSRLSEHANEEGTGIGLTITRKLVRFMGGDIYVKSNKGEGSCFTVNLPLFAPKKHRPAEIPNEAPRIKAGKVLVVDDSKSQLLLTTEILKNLGIETKSTSEPEKVIEILEKENFDALITDIQMPGINGYTLVKLIRNLPPPLCRIPVIAFSAQGDLNDYKEAGFSALIEKPSGIEKFAKVFNTGAICEKNETQKSESLFSLTGIRQFTGNDDESINLILDSFVYETKSDMEELERNFEDAHTISRIAHKMLPMFRQLNVADSIPLIETLERQRDISKAERRKIVDSLKKNIDLLLVAVEEHIRKN